MPKKPNGYWTEAKILEEAKKYKTLKEFREKANGAYCAASKLKITHKLYNLTTPGNIPNFWTKEKCFEEAKKYNTKIEFHDSAQGAWNASKRNGWLEEYTWLKSTRNANYGKTYTFNEINEITKKCFNKVEFKEKHSHQYKFARKHKWLDKLDYQGPIFVEVKTDEGLKRVCNNTDKHKPKIRKIKYTYDSLYEIAKQYTTLKDFSINESSAYTTANYRGWLKDYVWLEREHHFYTQEECFLIAQKCKNKTEFKTKDSGAYHFSLKNNLMNEYVWFENVKSTLEEEVEEFLIINNIQYIPQKGFKWLKYKNPQKLDFYLPDHNIAIECQGIQHFKDVPFFKQSKRTPIKILDENKRKLCEENGIRILYYSNLNIEYPYTVFQTKEDLLNEILNKRR